MTLNIKAAVLVGAQCLPSAAGIRKVPRLLTSMSHPQLEPPTHHLFTNGSDFVRTLDARCFLRTRTVSYDRGIVSGFVAF